MDPTFMLNPEDVLTLPKLNGTELYRRSLYSNTDLTNLTWLVTPGTNEEPTNAPTEPLRI